ncbi:zinc-dependent alcohol dehydrogenase family protein [Pseudohaliea rubra]|uniref:Alcohol dehydrogenase n=1 Tax=Pseudohaliea rubra DSM 19751 TaxID=1265313 RepID=A0A095WY21_9GAMM|nr:NAD(P)-dependent alcohol dehydrogenase [Pseudohaliea rubra]KGE03529.1 Alcohol dehydrogenase [Pseudohaliea rubra DSM 19751]
MRAWQLPAFGLDKLTLHDLPEPVPGPGEVLVRIEAASVNPRDSQIIAGHFTPHVDFPLVPLSDGAGTVTAVGAGVTRVAVGDLVAPGFFPHWLEGEALGDERKVSGGLETAGVLREYGVYAEHALVKAPAGLTAAELACFPCAGLTAWTALVEKSAIGAGNWVLIQGTGGVATAALQLAHALGANSIVLSSSNERLARARDLGATETINYRETPDWGERAYGIAGHGVDAVVEIGGAGTLPQSLAAIRHGGHVNVIGYVAGAALDLTVFPLIIRNANIHGIGTGHRANLEALLAFVGEKGLHPVIARRYPFHDAPAALRDLDAGGFQGKLVIDFAT